MTALLVILILLLAVLIFLSLTLITIKIDTYGHQYYVKVWGVVKCSLIWSDRLLLEVRLPFYRFYIDLLKSSAKKQKTRQRKQDEQAGKKPKKKGSSSVRQLGKVRKILKTFRLKKLTVDLDTSDVIANAFLYPLFFFLSRDHVRFSINYEGKLGVYLHLENRAIRIIRTLMKK